MSHKVRHTTPVRETYYYNRRVPSRAVSGFGQRAVRLPLSYDAAQVSTLSEALT